MSLKEFARELNGNRVEGELIRTIFYSILTSFAFLAAVYYFKLKEIDNFIGKYGFYLFFAALSYSLILAAVRQVRAYQNFPCMSGMMIGMTMGMISGFVSGFYIGATNGMFIGSVFGMIIGIGIGTWNGKCCGIMGVMEGIMAGFMGGLMGAMTALMMFNDNLKIAAGIIFFISSVILCGLNYLVFIETRETERQLKEDHFMTVALTFILIAITTWLMVYGPRSSLFT